MYAILWFTQCTEEEKTSKYKCNTTAEFLFIEIMMMMVFNELKNCLEHHWWTNYILSIQITRAQTHTQHTSIYFAENRPNCNFQSVLISLIGFVVQHRSNYVCIHITQTQCCPFLLLWQFYIYLFCLAFTHFNQYQHKKKFPRNKVR